MELKLETLRQTSSKQKTKNNLDNTDLRFKYNIKEFGVSRKKSRNLNLLYIMKI